MTKKALLIQINYDNDEKLKAKSEISINDVEKMLKTVFSYSDIIILKEEEATKKNIIDNLTSIINNSNENDELWFHYMGHSTTFFDEKNDSILKGLIPHDYKNDNMIYDNEIKNILVLSKCKMYIVLDCCYGNYGFNLNYGLKMLLGRYHKEDSKNILTYEKTSNIFCFSMGRIIRTDKKDENETELFSHILTRMLLQTLQRICFTISIDKIISLLSRCFEGEVYFSQFAFFSSNNLIKGLENYVKSPQQREFKIDVKYNLFETEDELKNRVEKFMKNKYGSLATNNKKIKSDMLNTKSTDKNEKDKNGKKIADDNINVKLPTTQKPPNISNKKINQNKSTNQNREVLIEKVEKIEIEIEKEKKMEKEKKQIMMVNGTPVIKKNDFKKIEIDVKKDEQIKIQPKNNRHQKKLRTVGEIKEMRKKKCQ